MGREWNDRLSRRLGDSIVAACDAEAGGFLVTDLEDSDRSLIEVLSSDRTRVIGEFLTRPRRRPKKPRYRVEVYEPYVATVTGGTPP